MFREPSFREPGASDQGSPSQIAPTAFDRQGFKSDSKLADRAAPGRIRCPRCRWQPQRRHMWTCTPAGAPEYFDKGCGTAWNTFDTRGRCPGCSYQWRHTMCLACGGWSAHDDWYEPDGKGGAGSGR